MVSPSDEDWFVLDLLDIVFKELCRRAKDPVQLYAPVHVGVLLIKQDFEGALNYIGGLVQDPTLN